jgi:hypothetical protein
MLPDFILSKIKSVSYPASLIPGGSKVGIRLSSLPANLILSSYSGSQLLYTQIQGLSSPKTPGHIAFLFKVAGRHGLKVCFCFPCLVLKQGFLGQADKVCFKYNSYQKPYFYNFYNNLLLKNS